MLRWPGETLRVLSLGCFDETYRIGNAPGLGTLGLDTIKLFMSGQSHGALGTAFLLTGHEHEGERVFRITHTVPKGSFGIDDTRNIGELRGMGFAMARERTPTLARVFFDRPADPFEPFHQLAAAA